MTITTRRKIERVTLETSESFWSHIKNWAVEYSLVPLSVLSVILLAKFAYYLSGRTPRENADALVGFGFRILDIAAIIIALSLTKEALGHWYAKEEVMADPKIAWPGAITTIAFGIIFAYLLSH